MLVVVAVIAFVLFSVLGKRKSNAGESIQVNMKCPKCGWTGIVSKYAVQCRKCGNKSMTPA
jgi:ribosomal protein S27E